MKRLILLLLIAVYGQVSYAQPENIKDILNRLPYRTKKEEKPETRLLFL